MGVLVTAPTSLSSVPPTSVSGGAAVCIHVQADNQPLVFSSVESARNYAENRAHSSTIFSNINFNVTKPESQIQGNTCIINTWSVNTTTTHRLNAKQFIRLMHIDCQAPLIDWHTRFITLLENKPTLSQAIPRACCFI